MTRVIRGLITAFLLILIGLLFTFLIGTAHASFCSSREDSSQAAPVVFTGRVLNITQDQHDDIVLLSVSQIWRGKLQSQAVLHTGDTSRDCGRGNCGYKFKSGSNYLVFAYEWPSQPGFDMHGASTIPPGVPTILMTDICSRTTLLSEAQQDLRTLGAGHLPLPPTGFGGLAQIDGLLSYLLASITFIAVGLLLRWIGATLRISRKH